MPEQALLTAASGSRSNAQPVASALATALLRSIRRLNVTGHGPDCVVELSFAEVSVAVRLCEDLRCQGDPGCGRDLRRWRSHNGLDSWAADAVPWARRLRQARAAAALIPGDAAFDQCRGRIVAGARACEFPLGAFDGAPGIELIFDDGSVATLARDRDVRPGSLLTSRLGASTIRARETVWHFEDARGSTRRLGFSATAQVLLQPSPVSHLPVGSLSTAL